MVDSKHPTQRATAERLTTLRPRNADQLHRFVRVAMGLAVPRQPIVPGNTAPFEYLLNAYFEDQGEEPGYDSYDAVVWANRGGGKTMLGATATLLDMLFKPGIQIRILGGSLEQSCKMHEHLMGLLARPWFSGLVAGEPTQRRIVLTNGSQVKLLAGSQRSVRGVRVHKLRCDEVEEFDRDVWQAAQLVTRSGDCGGQYVRGAVEALSTMHRPFGLMADITRDLSAGTGHPTRLFKWSAIDVIERCKPDRPCDGCVLWEDCQGKARHASGFIPVDDMIQQWHRASRRSWAVEMMCREPEVSDCVYPEFTTERRVHENLQPAARGKLIGGMDFGLRSPTVMLWGYVDESGDEDWPAVLHIVDEYVRAGITFGQHMEAIEKQGQLKGLPRSDWLGVDPAGNQRNSHTGISDVQALRRRGYLVRSRRSTLRDGIERVRRRLDHQTLLIHPRCVNLIEAMRCYHFDTENVHRQEPVKDGPDHLCDALRYMIVNLEAGAGQVTSASYL